MKILDIPKTINIYNEAVGSFNPKKIKDFIKNNFGNIKTRLIRPKKKIVQTKGLLFDLLGTQKCFNGVGKDSCHTVVTDKIFATIGEDKRPHIRASIYSIPSIISVSGIVEGPAKPREFYLYKQKYNSLGAWELKEPQIKKKFKGQFIDYQDARLTEVIKGYIAQALFFYVTGEAFCGKKSCRLFNAHWQKDLIYSQIKCGKFCKSHGHLLENIRKISND